MRLSHLAVWLSGVVAPVAGYGRASLAPTVGKNGWKCKVGKAYCANRLMKNRGVSKSDIRLAMAYAPEGPATHVYQLDKALYVCDAKRIITYSEYCPHGCTQDNEDVDRCTPTCEEPGCCQAEKIAPNVPYVKAKDIKG
ncbi:hypothetical protein JDV02_005318 [Purpureocillium takamizusanense]|uniref:Uncharacterized protein n=1 Tax=Purpureocillium takamizusanense TaxID=2060973 RepID=A0A9Q8QI74_9HYPO|nr:uncharacterized protein JDV02_005318 [Purpureocillium takamizusanense]UNI19102.1 hypothetical protein JDV02_005318 [Purpureocillium takamizusanense]